MIFLYFLMNIFKKSMTFALTEFDNCCFLTINFNKK